MTHATSLPRLTDRQREVLQRIAAGETNIEIATALGIGFETVKMHVSDILGELGVTTREDAARAWRERPGAIRRALKGLAPIFSLKSPALVTAGATVFSAVAVFGLVQVTRGAEESDLASPGAASQQTQRGTIIGDPTGIQVVVPRPAGIPAADFLTASIWFEGEREFAWPEDNAPAGFVSFASTSLPNRAGEVRVEVVHWRGDNDDVIVATEVIPWTGYTNPVTDVPLPVETTAPLGPLTLRLLEVFTTPDRVGVRWQVEGLPEQDFFPSRSLELVSEDGQPVDVLGKHAWRTTIDGPAEGLTVFATAAGQHTFTITSEAADFTWLTDQERAELEASGALSASFTIDLP